MQYPQLAMWTVRLGWLDWTNELRWTDWFEVEGYAEYRLNGVPVQVENRVSAGVVVDKDGKMLSGIMHKQGRYIPPHRIVTVDWEEAK